jgi:hypothetical protein
VNERAPGSTLHLPRQSSHHYVALKEHRAAKRTRIGTEKYVSPSGKLRSRGPRKFFHESDRNEGRYHHRLRFLHIL